MKQSAFDIFDNIFIDNKFCMRVYGRDIDRWIVKSWGKDKQRISNYRNKWEMREGKLFPDWSVNKLLRGEGKAFIDLHQVTVKSKPEAFKKIMEIWWNVTLLVHQWIEFHEEGSEISFLDTNARPRDIKARSLPTFFLIFLWKKYSTTRRTKFCDKNNIKNCWWKIKILEGKDN